MHRAEPVEYLQGGETTQKFFSEKFWNLSSTENQNI